MDVREEGFLEVLLALLATVVLLSGVFLFTTQRFQKESFLARALRETRGGFSDKKSYNCFASWLLP